MQFLLDKVVGTTCLLPHDLAPPRKEGVRSSPTSWLELTHDRFHRVYPNTQSLVEHTDPQRLPTRPKALTTLVSHRVRSRFRL